MADSVSTSNVSENSFINFMAGSSLESMAVVRIVANAWESPELKNAIELHFQTFYSGHSPEEEKENSLCEMESRIAKKLDLVLPPQLKDQVIVCITPMGMEIFYWMCNVRKYYRNLYDSVCISDSICWTVWGTVDHRKTFKNLLAKKNKDNVKDLYLMACYYCLQDHILELWQEISDEDRKDIARKGDFLVTHWTNSVEVAVYNCSGEESQKMLKLSMDKGHIAAVAFFWSKLSDVAKGQNIADWYQFARKFLLDLTRLQIDPNFHAMMSIDVFCFFLSQFETVEKQNEVFSGFGLFFANALFFQWPWQRFVLPMLHNVWDQIHKEHTLADAYVNFLLIIAQRMKKRTISTNLYRKIWHETPASLKKCFLNDVTAPWKALLNLLDIEEVETFELIMGDADAEERKRILFSLVDQDFVFFTLGEEKLPLIEIQDLLSENDAIEFKEKVLKAYGLRLTFDWIRNEEQQVLERFLNWCLGSDEKVDEYKKVVINRAEVILALLCANNNAMMDKLLHWCLGSNEKICQFKKETVNRNDIIASLGYKDWSVFERFIECFFSSDEEIDEFKKALASPKRMCSILHHVMVYFHSFEFSNKLLTWCLGSEEEILQFNLTMMASEHGITLFKIFADEYESTPSPEFLDQLKQWMNPLGLEVLINIGKNIADGDVASKQLFLQMVE